MLQSLDFPTRVLAKIHRAQPDALEIEAGAKRRLADEYDAAQERNEVATHGDNLKRGPDVPKENVGKATAADVGLSRKEIHQGREIRDAEEAEPGIVRKKLDEAAAAGEEPTRREGPSTRKRLANKSCVLVPSYRPRA